MIFENDLKFQYLPLNFPLNILVKITIFYNLTHVKHRITNQTKKRIEICFSFEIV